MPGKINGDARSRGLYVKQKEVDVSEFDPSSSFSSSSPSPRPYPNTSTSATSSSTSPLEDLAWQCTKNAVAVTQYLAAHDLPQPSHDADGPSRTLPRDAPPRVQRARQGLMDAALQLFQLAAGPSEFLPNLAPGFQYVACLAWLVRYDIFHLVPLGPGASISYAELAASSSSTLDKNQQQQPGVVKNSNDNNNNATCSPSPSPSAIPETRLKSIIRMAITTALFREPSPGRVAHSATSALLAREPDVHAWASYLSTRSAPTALAMRAAHDRFTPGSVAKDETAYNVAFDTGLPFFEHLSLDEGNVAEFAGYMRNVTTSEGVDVKHLVGGYPWAELSSIGSSTSHDGDDHGLDLSSSAGSSSSSSSSSTGRRRWVKVVDVGGSTGNAAIALAKAFPDLRFVVQDLPANADAGRAQLVEAVAAQSKSRSKSENNDLLPEDVLDRITFQGHDFTTAQPVTDGDVYLLRMILHDWPDHVAVTILRNLVPVLSTRRTGTGTTNPGGRGSGKRMPRSKAKLLIMDTVLPAPGGVPDSVERIVRVRDLTMMQVFNSHERDLEQWGALLGAADGKLKVKRVFEPFGSAMSLLEIELEEEEMEEVVEEVVVEQEGEVQREEEEEENWDISG